nr:hypothetical protein [uncultured Marinifilum sp.]
MEKEKTTIQKLSEFANKTDRVVDFTEQAYPSNALHPVTYHRRLLYIPENRLANTYFACFGDSRRFDRQSIFSGVFFPIPISKSTRVCVRKKDILDKMNLFSKNKGYKTGTNKFDSQVVFDAFDAIGTNRIFKNPKIHDLILKVFNFDLSLRVGINMVNLDFVPGLKGQSHFGIYSTQDWFVDDSKIEILYDLADQFKKFVVKFDDQNAVY